MLASASSAADICWHGAAQGAWKYRTSSVCGAREDLALVKFSAEVIFWTCTGVPVSVLAAMVLRRWGFVFVCFVSWASQK